MDEFGYSGGRSLPAYPGDSNTGAVEFWDMTTGEQLSRLDEGFNWTILSGDDLSAATDNLLFIDIENERALLGISNSEGGQHAVLVKVSDGSVLRSFENELAAGLTSAKFVDDDTILSATADAGLILWSSDDGQLIRKSDARQALC